MASERAALNGFEEDVARWREIVRERSAPYDRALRLLPAVMDGAPGRYVAAAWEHRRFHAYYDRPLLLLSALRLDALVEGPGHPLHEGFGAPARAEAVTADRLAAVLDGSRDAVFDTLAHRGVQTNETSRAIAWLWPAALMGFSHGARPVALADIGASAGLNLVADGLPSIWTDEDGAPIEVAQGVGAVARLGLDPAPLDAMRNEDALWLRACIWPGEAGREERLALSLAAFRAARTRPDAPVLVPIAARNVPARLGLLSAADVGTTVLAYQSVMRDYLEPAERAEYERGMRAWLQTHPPGRAIWAELEETSDDAEKKGAVRHAGIVVHVRATSGEVRDVELARCGFQSTRIRRNRAGEAELRALGAPRLAEAHA